MGKCISIQIHSAIFFFTHSFFVTDYGQMMTIDKVLSTINVFALTYSNIYQFFPPSFIYTASSSRRSNSAEPDAIRCGREWDENLSFFFSSTVYYYLFDKICYNASAKFYFYLWMENGREEKSATIAQTVEQLKRSEKKASSSQHLCLNRLLLFNTNA